MINWSDTLTRVQLIWFNVQLIAYAQSQQLNVKLLTSVGDVYKKFYFMKSVCDVSRLMFFSFYLGSQQWTQCSMRQQQKHQQCYIPLVPLRRNLLIKKSVAQLTWNRSSYPDPPTSSVPMGLSHWVLLGSGSRRWLIGSSGNCCYCFGGPSSSPGCVGSSTEW